MTSSSSANAVISGKKDATGDIVGFSGDGIDNIVGISEDAQQQSQGTPRSHKH